MICIFGKNKIYGVSAEEDEDVEDEEDEDDEDEKILILYLSKDYRNRLLIMMLS